MRIVLLHPSHGRRRWGVRWPLYNNWRPVLWLGWVEIRFGAAFKGPLFVREPPKLRVCHVQGHQARQ